MQDKRFTYTKIVHFNNCGDCPHCVFYGSDNDVDHLRCEILNTYVQCFLISGNEDFRNKDGVLDNCPYLENNSIEVHEQNLI